MHRVCSILVAMIFSLGFSGYAQTPFVTTQPAGPISATNATLNGMAVPNGYSTHAWFEWGGSTNYGFATVPTNIGLSVKVVRISVPIQALNSGGVYHYRLVASNQFGITLGANKLLTTGMRLTSWISTRGPGTLPPIPSGLTNVVRVASGHEHCMVIRSDGTVAAWGVGVSSYWPTSVPAGLSNVVAVAGGWFHALALKQDGKVVAWGHFQSSATNVPASLSNVVAIAGGDSHSIALKSDGTIVSWGSPPAAPAGLTNIVAISAGSEHSLALRADGKVIGWGPIFGSSAVAPAGLSNVVAISTETWHNLALRSNGTVVAWGHNDSGETNIPPGLSNVVAISAGFDHSLALKDDGTLVAWGYPGYVTNVPAGLSNVVAISSGDYFSMALSPANLAPRGFNRRIVGRVNTDLIISTSSQGWDPNGDAITFQITSLPTNGILYEYAGGTRGSPITAPGTPLTNPTYVIFSPQPDSFGAPYDSFGFVVNDGENDSAPAQLTVNVLPQPLLQSAGFSPGPNGGFALSFSGFSNANYGVQASTNLINWSRLGNATQLSPGEFLFLDGSATNRPERYYRLISP
jgi:alpha-tubulin suppressor-like RCC1 family protein